MEAFFAENSRINPLVSGFQWAHQKEVLVTYVTHGMRSPDEEACGEAVTRGGVYRDRRWTPLSGKAKPDYCVHGTTVRSGTRFLLGASKRRGPGIRRGQTWVSQT